MNQVDKSVMPSEACSHEAVWRHESNLGTMTLNQLKLTG